MDTFMCYLFATLYNGQSKAELTPLERNSSLLGARQCLVMKPDLFFFPEFRVELSNQLSNRRQI